MEMKTSRRHFLKAGVAASVGLAAAPAMVASPKTVNAATGRAPKNVIFLVSDGMSMGALTMASDIRRMQGKPAHWQALMGDSAAANGLMATHSLDSLVTDSSAASSAWGCGYKVANGMVCMAPDGTEYPTILRLAKAAGKRTGLVTTATVTHATPAGFIVNHPDRGDEPAIAKKYLEERPDVVLGGGRRHFTAEDREDGLALDKLWQDAGYTIIRDSKGLNQAKSGQPLLGLFSSGHIPFAVDREHGHARAGIPGLVEMTQKALELLSAENEGFILQVEAARVDHGAHDNDVGGTIFDQLEFDDVIGVAKAFVQKHPDTLLIITSDHATGVPCLQGTGPWYRGSTEALKRVSELQMSNGHFFNLLNAEMSAEELRTKVREHLKLRFTEEEGELLRLAFQDASTEAYRVRRPAKILLGQLISNHLAVGWSGTAHTSDWMPVTAIGPGCEQVAGHIDNTDLFALMQSTL